MVDTREQEPLIFQRLSSIQGALTAGDYSVAGMEDLFSIERKTVSDLVGCCMGANRERFERELHRLRGYRLVYDRARALKIEEHYDFTQWEMYVHIFGSVWQIEMYVGSR